MSRQPGYTSRVILWIRWSIVIALWSLLISMAAGQSGVSNFRKLMENKTALEEVNSRLLYENAQLHRQLLRLRSSSYQQKRYLKESFGMVEKNEVVVHFSKDNLPVIKTKYANRD